MAEKQQQQQQWRMAKIRWTLSWFADLQDKVDICQGSHFGLSLVY
jgi:hypothetical protein